MPFAAPWMGLEIIILSEISQTEKDKYHKIALICRILKDDMNELIYKTEIGSDFKDNLMIIRGEMWGK